MAWGFRKSKQLVPGVRLNIGKRSAGLSFGGRGARVSVNSRGRRALSVSKLGLFWRKRL